VTLVGIIGHHGISVHIDMTDVCRSVPGLDRPAANGHFRVALPEPAVEQVQHVPEALAR
jgi:hypothetical protein